MGRPGVIGVLLQEVDRFGYEFVVLLAYNRLTCNR